MSPYRLFVVCAATALLASTAQAQATQPQTPQPQTTQAQATTVCASGRISQFTAAAGSNSGGKWAPSMLFVLGGTSYSIGKDGDAPSPSEAWDTLRSAAQAAFLAQTPVQLLSSNSNCPTTSSPSGAQPFSIHMCVNGSDCGVSASPAGGVASRTPED